MAQAKRSRRKTTRHSNWPWAVFVVVVSAVVIGVITLLGNSTAGSASDPAAPQFTGTTLDNARISLSDFRGKVVMLNIWATWCPPCRAEMPILQDAYDKYSHQGFTILAINDAESRESVQAFATRYGLTFPIVLDPGGALQQQFAMNDYPTSLSIDPNGIQYDSHTGAVTPDILARAIETGLARIAR